MEQETANKKYILLENDTKEVDGRKLYRIKCIRNENHFTDGLLGGYIQSENNLSHDDNCWVGGNACVYGDAIISGNALVTGNAQVYNRAYVGDFAIVDCNAKVHGDSRIRNFARVTGNVEVLGTTVIQDYAKVSCEAQISGNAKILEYAKISGSSLILGCATVAGVAQIRNSSKIQGHAYITGNAIIESSHIDALVNIGSDTSVVKSEISGVLNINNCCICDSYISGDLEITNGIKIYGEVIKSKADFIVFKNWWSSGRTFAYFTRSDKFRVGCFYGTGAELIQKAYDDDYQTGVQYKRIVDYIETIKPELFLESAKCE